MVLTHEKLSSATTTAIEHTSYLLIGFLGEENLHVFFFYSLHTNTLFVHPPPGIFGNFNNNQIVQLKVKLFELLEIIW